MSSKINIKEIVIDHLRTLKNSNSGQTDLADYFTFLGIPTIISITLVAVDVFINKELIAILISALAIFVGLLFNILVLIFDIVNKESNNLRKIQLIKEVNSNISFTILISLIGILLLILTLLDGHFLLKYITNTGSYFILSLFCLTILMVLKRFYVLFKNEVSNNRIDK